MSIIEALVDIQRELKAPKDQKASKYRYRNIEDINEAVKPLAAKHGCAVIYSDSFQEGVCVSACKLVGEDGEIEARGAAYIERNPQYMSIEQSSGAASSYARKYAACGLFAIDSSENDPDRTNAKPKDTPKSNKQDDELVKAKLRLWEALKAWGAVHGGKTPEELIVGVKKRPEYTETPEYLDMVSLEFEGDLDG